MRRIEVHNGVALLELSRGQWAKLDGGDIPLVAQYAWYASPNDMGGFYAMSSDKCQGKRSTVYMHRLILDAPKGKIVDHWNHDTLDNRRQNLKLGGQSSNLLNRQGANLNSTSGIRGVYETGAWIAKAQTHRQTFPHTDTGRDAALAWLASQPSSLRRGVNKNSSTGILGLYESRYWNARIEIEGKPYAKNFPHTDEGKRGAVAWAQARQQEAK